MDNLDLNIVNLTKIVNLTPGLICISYFDGRFKYANASFVDILGYSKEEILQINIFSIIHPEDLEKVKDRLSDASRSKLEQIRLIFRYRCKCGEYKWISWDVKIEFEEGLVYGAGFDITEIKNVEDEMIKVKERLIEEQKLAHIGHWEYIAAKDKHYWSDELFCIAGYEPQEFVPTINSFLECVHPDDRTIAWGSMKKQISDEKGFENDIRIVRKDKSICWLHQRIKHEYDQSGKFLRAYGVVLDITEHKLNEARLKESQQKYKEITGNVPTGILSYDKDGNITFVNPEAVQILGSPSAKATMEINLFTFPPLVEFGVSALCKECIEKAALVSGEKQYTTKWGKTIVLRILATPIKDDNGEVLSAITILEDFTERKALENELRIAKEQAELSNRAKSQFLANMSHEIRTPMNGIIGMAELLKYANPTSEQKDIINMIISSSNLLLQIINDILDLSRIDAGKIELYPERVNIADLVKEKTNITYEWARNKALEFEVSISDNVPREILADKTRLLQVLNNLIGNAIKFTGKGKIKFSVSRVKNIADKVELMFSIADTGIGIKEEDIPRLFNYFTQLDSSVTKRFQGTGLGLAISKNLVQLMGGRISVESEYGKGSTFYFTGLFDLPQKTQMEFHLTDISVVDPSSVKPTILLVEDDNVSQLVIKQMCKLKGWDIAIASNGEDALIMLEKEQYDLILMDIQMHGMSGFDVTRGIRENEKSSGKHIPIIATTAYAMSGDAEKCLDAGMDDYVSKPIELDKLCAAIEKYAKNNFLKN